jgi:ABC-type branched-subunit amino acid transport system substrate-binding protein
MSENSSTSGNFGHLGRRGFLRLGGAGAAALGIAPLLAACGGSSGGGGGSTNAKTDVKTQTFDNVTIDDVKKDLGLDTAHLLAGKSINLGAILPLSGTGTYYGDVQGKGINLAAKLIKALGGPTVNVVEKDHKSGDPQAGVTAFRELAAQKIEFIYSTYIADFYALLPSYRNGNVFVLEGGQAGVTPQLSGVPHYWAGDVATDGYYPMMFEYIKQTKPNIKKIAAISVDVGAAVRAGAKIPLSKAASDAGFDLVMEEYVPYGTTEFASLLSKAQSKTPDALLNGMTPGGGLLARQAKQAGLNIPQYGNNLVTDDVAAGGTAFNGFQFSSYWLNVNAPGSRYAQWMVNEWNKAYGSSPLKPDAYGSIAFDIGMQMFQLWMAADKAGMPITQESLNKIASTTTVKSVFGGDGTGPAGTLTWDATTHFPSGQIGMFELTGGKLIQKAVSNDDGVTNFKLL